MIAATCYAVLMIYITGDTHNTIDMSNLSTKNMKFCCKKFNANYHDNIEGNKIRILYEHKSSFLLQMAQFLFDSTIASNTAFGDFRASSFIKIKMDLGSYDFGEPDEVDTAINIEDFDVMNCSIKHKKHFHKQNPEMPDD